MNAGSHKEITDEQRAEVMRKLHEFLEGDGDKSLLTYQFTGDMGVIEVLFEPSGGFADWALRESRFITEKVFNTAGEKLVAKGELAESTSPVKFEFSTNLAAIIAFLLVKGMNGKLISAFNELGLETGKLYEGFVVSQLKKLRLKKDVDGEVIEFPLPNVLDGIKELSKRIAAERKQFLTAQIHSLARKPQLEKLSEFYPMLLKVWKSAKKIYEDNGESETWRGMVRAKYPEITFDDDLLTRVTGKLENLSEDIQAKLAEKDGDHTPHTIALEHAARMCHAVPYQFGVRYLYKRSGVSKTELTESE